MSDQKIISPLLDGFTLGPPVSEHHGVVCCPAIKENTNKKYIVKIISVPATQSQFDALLLAGAYKDPGDVMEYFRGNGEALLEEAETLKKLSRLEGFLSYDGWQMEPITRRRLGYEVYLVGSYKRSLEKYMQKNAFTHLEAVNLALDLCSALSVCRQSGYLYGDLKPSNIYVSEKKEFRIGDLGFLRLDSLRYISLPERYFSPYTPPELLDPMTPMNLTVDTYAVGMILYQLYNDGRLPFSGFAPAEPLPSPCHADPELTEIILKAIHPDPAQRWTDPRDLGKAIASYMQKNSVNDIPITPFIPLDVKPEDIEVIEPKEGGPAPVEAAPQDTPEEAAAQDIPSETIPEEAQEDPPEIEGPTVEPDAPPEPDAALQAEEAAPEETDLEAAVQETAAEEVYCSAQTEPEAEKTAIPEDEVFSEEEAVQPQNPMERRDASPETEDPTFSEVSEEVAKILNQADDLIAHEIPEEAVFPAEPELPDPFAFVLEDTEPSREDPATDPVTEDPAPEIPSKKKKKAKKHYENTTGKKKIKKFFSRCFTLLLLGCAAAGGYWYYQNAYLQTIDGLSISGTQDQITVLVDTGVEESRLTVHCTGPNGKRLSEALKGGKATFSDLEPSTQYTISVDMAGFHKLVGQATDVFTTESTTQIRSFQAIAGPEDGSVILDFTVEGGEPDFWNIRYSAEGEEEKTETITSHSATITGLTIGKTYTFTLDGGKNFDVGGENSIQYLASRLILAEDLSVISSDGSDITVLWKNPGDVVVESWDILFHDGFGTEERRTVTENSAVFTGLDPASHYTVEVTAAGMTQPARLDISADPILASNFQIDESAKTEMKVTWDYSGNAPEGGWLLMYRVDGSGTQTVTCEKASARISPLIPGAYYEFVLQAADNRTVFNNMTNHQTAEAKAFTEHNFKAESVTIDLLKTPEEADWSFETIQEDAFTTSFSAGDSASMVLRSASAVYTPSNKVTFLFVYRDAYGNVLPELITEVTHTWKDLWAAADVKTGELDIPTLPGQPGDYKLELYCNGAAVANLDITITP